MRQVICWISLGLSLLGAIVGLGSDGSDLETAAEVAMFGAMLGGMAGDGARPGHPARP